MKKCVSAVVHHSISIVIISMQGGLETKVKSMVAGAIFAGITIQEMKEYILTQELNTGTT